MRVGNHLIAEVTAQDAISTLLKNPVYSKNQALVFENFTEPGLNWKKTLKMMRLAIEEGHYGALLAITKLPLSDDDIGDLQKLQHEGGFPIIGVSYANLPQELEPGSNGKLRVRTMKRLYEAGIPVIHSLRPLIAGINIGEEEIEAVVKETLPYSTVIVPGGLVVDPVILPTFELRGYQRLNIQGWMFFQMKKFYLELRIKLKMNKDSRLLYINI
jgi:DNA repair photolyase